VLRSALFVLLASVAASAQAPAHKPAAKAPETPATSQSPVADAEASIVKSDWKSAQTKLDAWLANNPADPRALFDAGYVADAENRPDDAVSLYRRAINADPKSFESHLSLGLLLARQGKSEEARPELAAATQLDSGDADPAMKARAWRALAQIDRPRPGSAGHRRSPRHLRPTRRRTGYGGGLG